MGVPGFTAHISLYKTKEDYQSHFIDLVSIVTVIPSLRADCYGVAYPCRSNWDGTVGFCYAKVCREIPPRDPTRTPDGGWLI